MNFKNKLMFQILLISFFMLTQTSCENSYTQDNHPGTLPAKTAAGSDQDPKVLTNSRQLTYVGNKSGEGYFSQDGKKLIFQSERFEGNPFYQIYLMDIQSGKTQMISTGRGKTTCAWIHPNGKQIMFSSSHLDKEFNKKVEDEILSRKSPQKNKYSWSFDDQFEIFSYNLDSKKYTQLTHARGYDAEGSYSPDGKWIAFASNRNAYTEKLNDEDAKMFKMDQSFLMSIYIMKADGTDIKRLTFEKGYNGGPFFSPDGKRITWRKFAPNGQSAEIWTMNVDGSDKRQLTKLGSMSWAPFYHPSGDYLIFTTNLMGFSNFELYIVDVQGEKAPVRVSYLPDFDGLPVFTPDGQKLAWTHRNEKGESQIYIGDWDDQKARKLLGLGVRAPRLADLKPEITGKDSAQIIKYLASDELAGRATGSAEELSYSKAIASLFQEMGLQPEDGKNFIQEFEYASGVSLGEKNSLSFEIAGKKTEVKVKDEFIPLSFSKAGEFSKAETAFAGYGIVAPANEKQTLFDSYGDLDVNGKWVIVFRDIPENIANERRIHLNMFSRLHHKALVAKERGAVGLLVVTGPNNPTKQKLMRLRYDGTFASTGIPVLSISDEIADQLLQSTGRNLQKWQDILDQGETQNTPIKNAFIEAKVDLVTQKSKGHNVVAKLSATNPADRAEKATGRSLLIGAHGDHLGKGDLGSSLARNDEQGKTHYGADDNASGVAGVLELAHSLKQRAKLNKSKLKQNIVFAVWSGEEIGLIGSSYYLNHTKEKLGANLNMDMIGRAKNGVVVQGVGSAVGWKNLIEQQAKNVRINVTTQEDPYLPTDSMAFYMKEIPAVNFFTGAHAEYHSPRDREELIQYDGLVDVIKLVEGMAIQISESAKLVLKYVKVESSRNKLEGRSFRIYLGTIPDYTQEGVKGVRINGTSKDSPAEKAGLKTGDVIVEVAGIKIENLYDYVYCLQSMKANQPTTVKVQREGRTEALSITPTLKE